MTYMNASIKLIHLFGKTNLKELKEMCLRSLKAGWVKHYLDSHIQGKWKQLF